MKDNSGELDIRFIDSLLKNRYNYLIKYADIDTILGIRFSTEEENGVHKDLIVLVDICVLVRCIEISCIRFMSGNQGEKVNFVPKDVILLILGEIYVHYEKYCNRNNIDMQMIVFSSGFMVNNVLEYSKYLDNEIHSLCFSLYNVDYIPERYNIRFDYAKLLYWKVFEHIKDKTPTNAYILSFSNSLLVQNINSLAYQNNIANKKLGMLGKKHKTVDVLSIGSDVFLTTHILSQIKAYKEIVNISHTDKMFLCRNLLPLIISCNLSSIYSILRKLYQYDYKNKRSRDILRNIIVLHREYSLKWPTSSNEWIQLDTEFSSRVGSEVLSTILFENRPIYDKDMAKKANEEHQHNKNRPKDFQSVVDMVEAYKRKIGY